MIIKYVKNLFIFCLLCFWLFFNSSVNAVSCDWYDNSISIAWWKYIIGSTYASTWNDSFSVWVLNKWGLFTQNLWFWKKVFALWPTKLLRWEESWLPYMHYLEWTQWMPKYYFTCPEITSSTDNFLRGCSMNTLTTWSIDLFRSFFSKVYQNVDYFWYFVQNEYYHKDFHVCISSHEVWSSICFVYYACSYNWSCPAWNCPLINSKSYQWLNFSNLPQDILFDWPWLYQEDEPWGDEWWGDEIVNVSSWWSVNVLCTKDVALQWYEKKWYSSNLCYWWLDNFIVNDWSWLWYLPIYWSWLDIEEIWFNTASYRQNWTTWNWMWYNEWFWYWRWLYDLHKKGVYSSNPFLWVPYVLLTYFGAVDIYWNLYNNKDILEYCDLDLYTADYSVMYSWVNVSQICTSSNIYEYLINNPPESNSDVNLSGDVDIWKVIERAKDILHGSGDNSSGDNSSGSNSSGSNLKTYTDWKSFIKDYVDLLNSEFDKHNAVWWNWILPTYILLALIWLVLFRFMAH